MSVLRSGKNYNMLISDLLALALSYILAIFTTKARLITMSEINYKVKPVELILMLLFLSVWIIFSNISELYDNYKITNRFTEFNSILKCILVQLIMAVLMLFFLKSILFSRFFLFIYIVSFLIFIIIFRFIVKKTILAFGKDDKFKRKILIIGDNRHTIAFKKLVKNNPEMGYEIIEDFEYDYEKRDKSNELLKKILEDNIIDDVIVSLEDSKYDMVNSVLSICDGYPVSVKIIPEYSRFLSKKADMIMFQGIPMISFSNNPLDNMFLRFVKRLFDVFISSLSLIFLFSWLYPIIAVAIKFSSKGQVFFKQERWGKKNKKILVYKFRTMKNDSSDIDTSGRYNQARKNDPRITRIGKFLRKTNLDELPQLINVFIGNMSIVGPRPHPTPLNIESKGNIRRYLKRHLIKPGITGWAQVNGLRGETKEKGLMEKRVEYDIWYIENWSLWLDIQIIFMTVWNMLRGDKNAY